MEKESKNSASTPWPALPVKKGKYIYPNLGAVIKPPISVWNFVKD